MILNDIYQDSQLTATLVERLGTRQARLHVDGMTGSLPSVIIAAVANRLPTTSHLVIAPTKEEAFYLSNDLEALFSPTEGEATGRVMLFPTSYRKAYLYNDEETENANVLLRSEVIKEMAAGRPLVVVSYPEALSEKVVGSRTLLSNTLRIARDEKKDMWDVVERLQELGFEREDFVVEPGQYAVRGGIVDVYSYASDLPYRIEFFDDEVDSLRTYDAVSQLSVKQLDRVDIVPNFGADSGERKVESKVSLLEYFAEGDTVWVQSLMQVAQRVDALMDDTRKAYNNRLADKEHPIAGTLPEPEEMSCTANEFLHRLLEMEIVEYGNSHYFSNEEKLSTNSEPQPVLNKQFDLLTSTLARYAEQGYQLLITVSNDSQERRLRKILDEAENTTAFDFQLSTFNLSHGFIDHDEKVLCFTDHEIFERYHKYTVLFL